MTKTAQPAEISSEELSDSLNTTMMRRILASSFLGSMIEFYDFILFATAASIVFSQVFFVDLDPAWGSSSPSPSWRSATSPGRSAASSSGTLVTKSGAKVCWSPP